MAQMDDLAAFSSKLDDMEKRISAIEDFLEAESSQDDIDPIELYHRQKLASLRDQ